MNRQSRIWPLQEAKAKFSELVRRAQTEGPQTVTVHGQAAVTITKAEPAAPFEGKSAGEVLRLLRQAPAEEFSIPDWETEGCFRDVDL
ncbi:MAG: type II toxin-antitoxin system prevent-host-death family antitoxin [Hyphomicrobiales bacterium]